MLQHRQVVCTVVSRPVNCISAILHEGECCSIDRLCTVVSRPVNCVSAILHEGECCSIDRLCTVVSRPVHYISAIHIQIYVNILSVSVVDDQIVY